MNKNSQEFSDFLKLKDMNEIHFEIPRVTMYIGLGEYNIFQAGEKMMEVIEDYMFYVLDEYWNNLCEKIPGGRFFSRKTIKENIIPDLKTKIGILRRSEELSAEDFKLFFSNHNKEEGKILKGINDLYEKYDCLNQNYFLSIKNASLLDCSDYVKIHSKEITQNKMLLASRKTFSFDERQLLQIKFFRPSTLECSLFIYLWLLRVLKDEIDGVIVFDV